MDIDEAEEREESRTTFTVYPTGKCPQCGIKRTGIMLHLCPEWAEHDREEENEHES